MVLFLQDTFFSPADKRTSLQRPTLKVPERIYLRVGYVFESRFSAGII